MRVLAVLVALSGCVELGIISDGTSVSVGRPSRGRIVDGVRLPDRGEGFFTREIWRARGNRYGTDELVDLITGVSRRVAPQNRGLRVVVADLSGKGGAGSALAWHRSHQSGRDVDLLYYVRDQDSNAVEPDAMRKVGKDLVAVDGSGYSVDIPMTWNLVRELITAPEAPVQWVFMYQPVANALVEHATKIGEPAWLIDRAQRTCKQPNDSAPHNDHMHVRVYCSTEDRAAGCIDVGPMDRLAEREADFAIQQSRIAAAIENPAGQTFTDVAMAVLPPAAGDDEPATVAVVTPSTPSSSPTGDLRSIQRLLRTGAYRVDLWRWR